MFRHQTQFLLAVIGCIAASIAIAFFIQTAVSQPSGVPVSWDPSGVEVAVPAGRAEEIVVFSTTHQDMPAVNVDIVPELSSFVSVEPDGLPPVLGGLEQIFVLTFQVPADAPPGTFEGTLRIREGSRTTAQPLPIIPTITGTSEVLAAKGLELAFPTTWHLDEPSLDIGGPISLNNFGGAYRQGGLRPSGGAEIDITVVQLPALTLEEAITRDLQGTTFESTADVQVGGESGIEVIYSFELIPSLEERNTVVYVPHNQLLYKFFLSYQLGDPREVEFLNTFYELLESVQFTE